MNSSTNDTVSHDTSEVDTSIVLALLITYGFMLFAINLFTLIAIVKHHTMREKYGILVGSFCMADIFVGMCLVFVALDSLLLIATCAVDYAFHFSLQKYGPFVSMNHTVCMTIDRFIAIKYPLHYHQIMTPSKLKMLVTIAWIVPGVVLFPDMFFFIGVPCKSDPYPVPVLLEFIKEVMYFVIVFIVNVVLYLQIWCAVKKMQAHVWATNQSECQPGKDKLTVMVFLITVMSIILWTPYLTGKILKVDVNILVILAAVGLCNSLVNNIIYASVNKDFKRAYAKMLHCKA